MDAKQMQLKKKKEVEVLEESADEEWEEENAEREEE